MFTGIVEEVGTIDTISRGANSAVLTIRAEKVLAGTKVGDSIAVNGICLTVTRLMPHAFTADVMHETLNRSSLANALRGAHVNLERAMAADGRFGGHIVSGHVDGTGRIVEVYNTGRTTAHALYSRKGLRHNRWNKPHSRKGCRG